METIALSATKERIVLAAGDLFLEKGFQQTTVRDLANAVGIQSGSLFHHFQNKEAILAAVMARSITACTQKLEAVLSQALNLRDKVCQCVLVELALVNGRGGEALVLLVSEWQHLAPDQVRPLLQMREVYESHWLALLERAQVAGHLQGPAFLVRKMLMGAIGWSHYWFQAEKNWSLPELADKFVTVFWNSPS